MVGIGMKMIQSIVTIVTWWSPATTHKDTNEQQADDFFRRFGNKILGKKLSENLSAETAVNERLWSRRKSAEAVIRMAEISFEAHCGQSKSVWKGG